MAKKFDVTGKGIGILSEKPEKKFNAKEIAGLIYKRYPNECEAKSDRSSRNLSKPDLIQQIAREWHSHWRRAMRNEPRLRATDDRPKLFYFSNNSEEDEVLNISDVAEPIQAIDKFSEHDLYPILGEFIAQELNCYSMRINESKSSNTHGRRGNHWLYPDVVGMIALSQDWHREIDDLSILMKSSRIRLCSFEVKKTINRSNVREVVFQTVSNSSWANYAYLAAESIEDRAAEELRMLCLAHGIGYIKLDRKNSLESQIQIPSKFNDQINFDLLNRLAKENSDAVKFLENVTTFLKTKKERPQDWDLYSENIEE